MTAMEHTLIAAEHRLRALSLGWRSDAQWKDYDAELEVDANEQIALRREALAYGACAAQLDEFVKVLSGHVKPPQP